MGLDESAIIDQPNAGGPGWLRRCPGCERWFALEPKEDAPDAPSGELQSFVCKACGKEITFARPRPPWAV